jgi:hypothetical protein
MKARTASLLFAFPTRIFEDGMSQINCKVSKRCMGGYEWGFYGQGIDWGWTGIGKLVLDISGIPRTLSVQ